MPVVRTTEGKNGVEQGLAWLGKWEVRWSGQAGRLEEGAHEVRPWVQAAGWEGKVRGRETGSPSCQDDISTSTQPRGGKNRLVDSYNWVVNLKYFLSHLCRSLQETLNKELLPPLALFPLVYRIFNLRSKV